MVLHNIQPSFAGGEVSPHLQARVDLSTYNSWLKTASNFYVHTQGGASNRQGTAFMALSKYTEQECRIIPFVLSETEAYVLELGEKYLRVHTSNGIVLEGEAVYEIQTPYDDIDVKNINYVQCDQTLYLTHPAYAPKKLVCTQTGRFELSDMGINGGPFMLANTDETKKMHLITQNDQIETAGVSASLSFLPINYPQCFVQAYFRGIHFYNPIAYGFNVADVVNEFNRLMYSTGCVAYNLGGVLKIESPKSNGGDFNGAELVIHYRRGIVSPPILVVVEKMSGGINAGVTEVGENKFILESDFDAFKPDQTGGYFCVTHRVDSQRETGTITYTASSNSIKTGGDWRLRTNGNWSGSIVVESSADKGVTWEEVKHLTRATTAEENLNILGNLEPSSQMHYLRVRALGITGSMGYELLADGFYQEGILKLMEYLGPRQMRVVVKQQLGAEDWTYDWAEGSFSQAAGFPTCIFFYQDRLGFAGTKREPQTIWFSKTGEYEDFGHLRTVADADGISINLSSKKLNAINSVAVASRLLLFTAGSEWTLNAEGGLTPYNIQISQQGERGASRVTPLVVGNRALFVQARGGVLRDFFYDYSSASYTGEDLTLMAKHLFFNTEIQELSYQQEPDNLIWCVLRDGNLLTLTYSSEGGLCAWTRHQTQGLFRGVCTIPSHGYDETWFVVERNGKKYIERLLQRMVTKEPQDQVFLDASISKKSTEPFTELAGLEHLEGLQVGILADGNPLPLQTVTGGKIVLPHPVSTAHAGLGYESVLQTLPVEVQTPQGTLQDSKRRVVSLTVKLLESRGGAVGSEGGKLDELLQRTGENFNEPVGLKTQDYTKVLPSVHSRIPSIIFKQQEPLPVTVLAFITQIG